MSGPPRLFLMNTPKISLQNIHKTYSSNGIKALNGVCLEIMRGKVNTLLGENAAGKTTLMKIISGIEKADSGAMFIDGVAYSPRTPIDAIEAGVGLVPQNMRVISGMTVMENLLTAMNCGKLKIGLREMKRSVHDMMQRYKVEIDSNARVGDLTTGDRQRVAILRVLLRSPDLIILDEPTAVLSDTERESLFMTLSELKKEGKTLIFITHRLSEATRVSDRIAVMRKGSVVDTVDGAEVARRDLHELITGESLEPTVIGTFEPGKEVLRVESLEIEGRFRGNAAVKGVDFSASAGELLVITGVTGNGQQELLEGLFGMRRVLSGRVFVDGQDLTGKPPSLLRKAGVAALTSDRDSVCSCPALSIMENLVVNRVREAGPIYRKKALTSWSKEIMEKYNVKYSALDDPASTLSGGNLQKMLLARELDGAPVLLLLGEPTRGLDSLHTRMLHKILASLREKMSVVVFTGDIDEALAIGNRVIVMYDGRIVLNRVNDGSLTRAFLGRYIVGTEKTGAVT